MKTDSPEAKQRRIEKARKGGIAASAKRDQRLRAELMKITKDYAKPK